MKSIKNLILLLLVITTISATDIFAQRGRNQFNQGNTNANYQNRFCLMIPNLTQEQETKIETLRMGQLKDMNLYRNKMDELRVKKRRLIYENASTAEINAVIDQMTALKNKQTKMRVEHHKKIRNLLTEEQQIYFDNYVNNGYGRGRGIRGNAGRGRGMRCGRGMRTNNRY